MLRVDEILRAARASSEPAEAELLLAHVLGRPRSWLYAHGDATVPESQSARFDHLIERRRAGEPVAYLVGRRGFHDIELTVSPATLIPRAETELLVDLALARLPSARACAVADLGTGSGAVALALAKQRPRARVLATDASAAALEVAAANARELALDNVGFALGDWYQPLAGARFDLIASNPPYIAAADPHLGRGDLRYEPAAALASGPDGLEAIRVIAAGAATHLVAGGWLLVEHGLDQGAAVRELFAAAGLQAVTTDRDLEGRDRVTAGRRPD